MATLREAARLALVLLTMGTALACGGEESSGGGGGEDPVETPIATPAVEVPKLPEQQTTDLEEAVEKAGCELTHPKYEGADHEDREFTAADYKTNPPTSGAHFPTWYDDGVYKPGDTPELGQLVHTLEHGRINVQYKPGTPADVVAQLEAFVEEKTGYHLLLHENATEMPFQVAATAWTHLVGCAQWSPEVVDVLRAFHQTYVDKGPEQVP